MKRRKNPFGNYYKDYLNHPISYEITYEDWLNKNPYESDECERCRDKKEGPFDRCPRCKI